MFSFVKKILGSKSQKDVKLLMPLLAKIKNEGEALQMLSHDDLRKKTWEQRDKIHQKTLPIKEDLDSLRQKITTLPSDAIEEKENIFEAIEKKEKEKNSILEKALTEALPIVFAIVKETARRFKEEGTIEVQALDIDRTQAAQSEHVSIKGEQAVWAHQWMAAGSKITWDMIHYDVQLIGGIVLHQGKIAEMATGEGKTLVATLPAFLNALAGKGVHIVTVNSYLAQRDSEWMAPLFQFHGITIDCIDQHEPNSFNRRKAYEADITYGTNNEFGFDYLRDNMARDPEDIVQQRGLHYAMVDEVDSVLIDEARTPLIISGPIPKGNEHEFYDLKPRIQKLVHAQKELVTTLLNDAKKKINTEEDKEGSLSLLRAHRAMPRHKPLIKFLSEPGIKNKLQKTENLYLQDNKKMMPVADEPLFFVIEEKDNSTDLTDKGIELITQQGEDPHFFILPEIGTSTDYLEKDVNISDKEKIVAKEKIIKDYNVKAQRIHTVNQLLKAYTLFEKDTDYIIVDDKVKIVDEQTGRALEGRRYSDGLHQAIEAKENVKVEDATQTYATVTLQNYFRMYHKLAGMTGTAETEAGEFWDIYKLDVVVIPTHRPIVRSDENDMVYKTVREKFNAVVNAIDDMHHQGRPTLVGTTSVEISELLSRMLRMKKIKHQVLNAKQHQKEAEIVAEAGKPGTVTIATNMAGRGTDIKLSLESKEAGGLAIIGTERHDSRRVDRQLRGRSGRQGDPGSSQFYVSLEDNLMRLFMPERIARIMDRLGLKEGEVISHGMVTNSIERAQKKVEENNFGIRKRLLEYDNVMNSQREIIYKRRKHALHGERLALDRLSMLSQACDNMTHQGKQKENFEDFRLTVLSTLGIDLDINAETFKESSAETIRNKIYQSAITHYAKKNETIIEKVMPAIQDIYDTRGSSITNILVPLTDGTKQIAISVPLKECIENDNKILIQKMEKMVMLTIIDQQWKDHLRGMDDLKQSVQNAVYEQKDPLLIYKFEAFEAFKQFTLEVNKEVTSFLSKANIALQSSNDLQEARTRRAEKLQTSKEESQSLLQQHKGSSRSNHEPITPVKSQKIAGRNDRIDVQYTDGKVLKEVKYKKVEEDIKNGKCVVLE